MGHWESTRNLPHTFTAVQLLMTSTTSFISSVSHAGHKHPNGDFALSLQILCRTLTGVLQQQVFKMKLLCILLDSLFSYVVVVIKWWKKEPKELSLDLPRGFSLPWGDWDTQLLDLQKILLPYMSTQFISGHRLKFPTKCQKRSGNAHSKGCTRVNHLMSSRPSLSCNTSKNIGESISKKISAWAYNLPTFLTPLTSAKPQCHKDLTKGTTLLSSISEIQPVTRSRRVDT